MSIQKLYAQYRTFQYYLFTFIFTHSKSLILHLKKNFNFNWQIDQIENLLQLSLIELSIDGVNFACTIIQLKIMNKISQKWLFF